MNILHLGRGSLMAPGTYIRADYSQIGRRRMQCLLCVVLRNKIRSHHKCQVDASAGAIQHGQQTGCFLSSRDRTNSMIAM